MGGHAVGARSAAYEGAMVFMAAAKLNIGYFVTMAMADNVFMGGAMVTDLYGLPLEFRYTDPVRATKLQRILYGDVLERYIQTDVILLNLLDNLEQKPQLLIVGDAAYLPAIDGKGHAAVWIGETHSSPMSEIGATAPASDKEVLVQATATGAPIRVKFAPSASGEDMTPQTRQAKQSEIVKQLTEASLTMDLFEPQKRVEKALKLLWDEMDSSRTGAE